MFYIKRNVKPIERGIRFLAGAVMIAGGLIGLQGQVFGYILAGMGVIAVVTGLAGYCPMCAIVGKKSLEE